MGRVLLALLASLILVATAAPADCAASAGLILAKPVEAQRIWRGGSGDLEADHEEGLRVPVRGRKRQRLGESKARLARVDAEPEGSLIKSRVG